MAAASPTILVHWGRWRRVLWKARLRTPLDHQPPAFANFEADNDALLLDGFSVDVSIPPLNLSGGPNVTLAAWIKSKRRQAANAGINLLARIGGFGTGDQG